MEITNIKDYLPLARRLPVYEGNKTIKNWTKDKPDTDISPSKPYGIYGYLILDLDPHGETEQEIKNNLLAMLSFMNTCGIDVNTFTVMSKGGGMHLYYQPLNHDFINRTGWLKTDYGNVDLRGSKTWVRGPSFIDEWSMGKVSIINSQEPITFSKLDLIPVRQTATTANVFDINTRAPHGPSHYLQMALIPKGEREQAMFQLVDYWYKQGKSLSEVKELFEELKPRIEEVESFNDFDVEYKYNRVAEKLEATATSRLDWALKTLVYIKNDDMIYNKETRKAYKREPFKFTINDKHMTVDGKPASLTATWLNHEGKYMVDHKGWRPDDSYIFQVNGETYANTYVDRTFLPWHEEVRATDEDLAIYFELLDNLFMGDQRIIQLYLSSVAYKLRNPTIRQFWAWFIMSPLTGTGKGSSWHTQARVLGNYHYSLDLTSLDKDFNSFLFGTLNILVDEADDINKTGTNKTNRIKKLVTDPDKKLHAKGRDVADNATSLYYTAEFHTNSVASMKIAASERRYALVHCTNPSLTTAFLDEYKRHAFLNLDDTNIPQEDRDLCLRFYRKLTKFLLTMEIHADYSPDKKPDTPWQHELSNESKSDMAGDIMDILNGDSIFAKSDIQTAETIAQMLTYEKNYPHNLTPRKCSAALNELVLDGVLSVIHNRGGLNLKLTVEDTGTITVKKKKARIDTRLYAVRNKNSYPNIEAMREGFYPHIP